MKGVRTMARQWTRRQFLWLAGGAVLAAGGGLAYYERRLMQRALATATGVLDASYVRQIVAADNAHARTLMWQAAAEQAGAAVELRRAGETAVQSFPATSVPYADDGVSAYLQTAQLTDLAPGQAYEYRLRYGEDAAAWQPLTAAGDDSFDLVLSAHLHTYRNRGHIRDFQRDERGPLYVLTGVAGNVRYPDLWQDHTLDLIVAPQPEVDNYLTLKGDTHTLTLASYQPDGAPIDEVTLRKS